MAQYNEKLNKQNGCCAICERHHSEFIQALAVDHCHSTGDIRGLLCINCNQGLGKFKDNPDLLVKGIDYLNQFKRSS